MVSTSWKLVDLITILNNRITSLDDIVLVNALKNGLEGLSRTECFNVAQLASLVVQLWSTNVTLERAEDIVLDWLLYNNKNTNKDNLCKP